MIETLVETIKHLLEENKELKAKLMEVDDGKKRE